ncbi:MAG: glycoside hydrolase family 3 C-terminal domain-containing protein, partial [Oscillospiraceae bacterium]|nr:glycoside hydrolase family 3 C-terminal domain-containing protein [Oscillospiraceae bacterium]
MKKMKHRVLSFMTVVAMIFSCTPALSYYEPVTDELYGLTSREVGIRVAEEGMVLLKNDNQALPLKKGDTIAVFGINQVDYIHGGGGSG